MGYPEGPVAYFQYIDTWRTSGEFAGLEFRVIQVVVIGGGVAGLASRGAARSGGHDVTVIERDDTPMPATADEAFEWDRRGAPQVRHSHAFLARLRNLLADHQPDILEALLAEGATEMRFGDGVPPDMEFTAASRATTSW